MSHSGDEHKDPYYDTWIKRTEAIYLLRHRYNIEELKNFFVEKLSNDGDIENDEFKLQIHIDFNLETLRFCLNSNFSAEQTSTFISIINSVFRDSLKKKQTTDASYERLESIFNGYLHQTPPFSMGFFSQSEINAIFGFVTHLFKFFQMYEISMTKFVDFNVYSMEYFPEPIIEEDLALGEEIQSDPMITKWLQPVQLPEELAESVEENPDNLENDAGGQSNNLGELDREKSPTNGGSIGSVDLSLFSPQKPCPRVILWKPFRF